ncbi:hypothetical protein Daesc_000681 [Daldinia eschscholtzii]|uniref:Ubiquitin-like domain-containing protein n=1 Tax=Daldinia eschscholtzii TaxID=292717 RepID=A0AAX6N0D9_9PEZI
MVPRRTEADAEADDDSKHRHITVNVNNPDVEAQELQLINLDVPPDMTLADLRSSIEAEGIPAPSQNIYHNGQLITDNSKTLQELNISDGDMLALHVRDMRGNTGVAPAHREPQRRQPAALAQDPELIRLQVLGDARLRGELERANPQLAAALENPPEIRPNLPSERRPARGGTSSTYARDRGPKQ